ncbi:MAG TPA: Spy/CpxP family protein refolding chaperone [Terriglobales bacterium]|jgi:periplasmic protein CpxP/Spy|nr:Spy/CpxP family protein refolding chaperone [Terriglobales bacterium]
MKTIRFRLLIAAVTVLLGTALTKAQTAEDAPPPPPMHGHEFGMGHMMGFFAKDLDLTADQQAQMKAVIEKEHPVIKPLMQQSRQIEQQLHQYAEGSYNETKVRALAAQQAQVELELTVQRTRIHNELYQLLTADQQAKLKDLEATREARMQQHMQDAPPPPPEE